MKRLLFAVTIAAATGAAALAQTQTATPWNIGNVFLGIGNGSSLVGLYRVFNPDGTQTTNPDLSDNAGWLTTGCAIDPTIPNGDLYTTSWSTVVSRIPNALPHGPATSFDLAAHNAGGLPRAAGVAALPTSVSKWEIESVVFDREGNMYLGALEAPDSAYSWLGHGWIVKVSKPDAATGVPTLLGWWQVDAGDEQDPSHSTLVDVHGADWMDLSNDETTIYYTSEDGYIRSFSVGGPNAGQQGPAIAIRYTADGAPIGSKSYAIRILPPGDPANGFLVATAAGVYRLDASGLIVKSYVDPAQTGYFSLNITPDGAWLWTATLNGSLYKFHIASGAMFGPFTTGVEAPAGSFAAYGSCAKGEYTASQNVCFTTDVSGNAIPDANDPTGYKTQTCILPPSPSYCATHPDDASCNVPILGPPVVTVSDQTTPLNTSVSYQLEATSPNRNPLAFSITGLPAGLSMDASGLVTGTPTVLTDAAPVTVTVTDEVNHLSTAKTFTWSVVTNRPPVCSAAQPSQALWPPTQKFVDVSVAGVVDPDADRVTITIGSIWQDEPVDTTGGGTLVVDGAGIGTSVASVLAAHSASSDGRIYQINFTADDGNAGGTCTGSVLVGISHDKGQQIMPLDTGARYDSITGVRIR